MRRTFALLALAAAIAAPVHALAADDSARPRARWLGKAEVEVRIAALGYSVKKIKNGVGRYEVKATGKDGKDVELYVDPWTGVIVNPGQ